MKGGSLGSVEKFFGMSTFIRLMDYLITNKDFNLFADVCSNRLKSLFVIPRICSVS